VTRWLAKRLLQAIATFAIVVVLLFVLMRLAPGDPLQRISADRPMNPADVARLRTLFGLDQPISVQFVRFVSGAVRGDLGTSIEHYPDRVSTLIRRRFPATLLLGGVVLLVNFTLGIWLGAFQASRPGRAADRWLDRIGLVTYTLPAFWLGLMLVAVFSIQWHLLPPGSMSDPLLPADAGWGERLIDLARHLLLPALTLSIVTVGGTMRYQRAALGEVLGAEYVVAARARGLADGTVLWRHAWPNALFPMLTLFGLWLPVLVTGAVFVEAVFNWPGLGSLAAESIAARDYPLIMGTSILVAVAVILSSLVVDLAYRWLDPRVRLS
jgi:peptide/nickel transport system permease protein